MFLSAWLSEIKYNFCKDYRIVWDWMKYYIRSISYSKQKAGEKREKLKNVEETFKMYEENTAEEPSHETLQK